MAQGEGGGRPPLWESPEEMQKSIDQYFANPPTRQVSTRDGIEFVPAITITGLALHLGFESRQSFYDYGNKSRFAYIIKRARAQIENEYEKNLQGTAPTGSIFALKNFGWKDKQELEVNNYSDLSAEERLAKISQLQQSISDEQSV